MLDQPKIVAILAGSRKNEVTTLLPNFIKVATKLNNAKVVVAGAPGLDISFYNDILVKHHLNATVVFNQTFDILQEAKQTGGFALVASGTATLETALFKVPQVVAYRVNKLTYFVGKQLLKIPYISLVNILLQRSLIEEHLQKMDVETLWGAVQRLQQEDTNKSILAGYDELWAQLSAKGTNVSENVARLVLG